jgi:hypothetical protein
MSARGNPAPIDRGMQLLADAFFKIQTVRRLAVCLNFLKHFWREIICSYRRTASRTRERDRALSDKLKQSGVNFGVSRPIWKVDVFTPNFWKPQVRVPTCMVETPQDKLLNICWLHVRGH